jgi:hypothetical protein
MSEECTWRELLDAADLLAAGKAEAERKVEQLEQLRACTEDPEVLRIRDQSINQTIHHARAMGTMAGMCSGYATCLTAFSFVIEAPQGVRATVFLIGLAMFFFAVRTWRWAQDVRFSR